MGIRYYRAAAAYIKVARGWMYLTIILDLYDRKVVGWAMSESLKAEKTVLPAWRMANLNRPVEDELIFHRIGDPVRPWRPVCLS